jgi:hypothetical protein
MMCKGRIEEKHKGQQEQQLQHQQQPQTIQVRKKHFSHKQDRC